MKKRAIRYLFLLFLLLLFTLPASAEEASVPGGQWEKDLDAFRSAVPPEVREFLPESFFSADLAQSEAGVREGGGISAVLSAVGKLTGLAIGKNLALLAEICGLLLLSAVFRALVGTERRGVGEALSFCATLALSCLLLGLQRGRFSELETYFTSLRTFCTALLPMMGTLYAMGGNLRAAVVNHGVFSAFLAVLENFCAGTVLPVAGICVALALPDAVSGKVDLRPLAGLIKRTYTLILSFLMLCGVLGVQSTLAKAGDTLALRTARFAAGSFLPVVGGSVSETLRTVAGSVEYLRGVAGPGAMLVLFFLFLPVFLSMAVTRVAFLLGGAAAKLFSCEAEEKILAEFASVYGYFLAVIASLFVMLIFSLTLFARCAAA